MTDNATLTEAPPATKTDGTQDLRPRCLTCNTPVDTMADDYGAPSYSVRMNMPCRCVNAGLDFRHLAPTT